MRNACKRHLADLRNGSVRGLVWDIDAANRVYEFFETVLRLNGGEHEGKPFLLEPWQKFIVGNLFGWKQSDGTRRFRVAFIEIGKGSGKSPLAAGIGLYMLAADGESRAEVYAAAVDKDQAKIMFRDAVAMVDQSPALNERIQRSGGMGREWNLSFHQSGSFFRPISSENSGRGKSGARPHCALLDEVHEHPTDAMVEFLRAGTKGRRQALILMITNSGFDQSTVCYSWHSYVCRINEGADKNDAVFGYVCGLDEGDDWTDKRVWIKANPNLGVSISERYLAEQVEEAKGMPSKQSIVKRLNFCQWVGSANVFIPLERWQELAESYDEVDLLGQECHAGLDLSWSKDLSAFVLVFHDIDGTRKTIPYFWLPEDGLELRERQDRVPYTQWVEMGALRTTPGAAIDLDVVARDIQEICGKFRVKAIACDRMRALNLIQEFNKIGFDVCDIEDSDHGYGVPIYPWGQGYIGMAPAVDALENAVVNGSFRHPSNPVLTWNNTNVNLEEDPAGNRKFNKRRSTGRIDGMVALAMAMGSLANSGMLTGPSIYETQGIVTV